MISFLCYLWFRLTGWSFRNDIPDELRSFVLIGGPHTSNHDFIEGMAGFYLLGRNTKFVIKNEWMRFPLNIFFRPLGAVGLDRSKAQGNKTTDLMAGLFKQYSELVLAISPEGSRSPREEWKTGFYYIAQKAGVPIVLAYLDHKKKIAGVAEVIYPKEFEQDMRKIISFYSKFSGRRPENFKLDKRFGP